VPDETRAPADGSFEVLAEIIPEGGIREATSLDRSRVIALNRGEKT
jgi:hypothetical protein